MEPIIESGRRVGGRRGSRMDRQRVVWRRRRSLKPARRPATTPSKRPSTGNAKALRRQVDELAKKNYGAGGANAADFTVTFVPCDQFLLRFVGKYQRTGNALEEAVCAPSVGWLRTPPAFKPCRDMADQGGHRSAQAQGKRDHRLPQPSRKSGDANQR